LRQTGGCEHPKSVAATVFYDHDCGFCTRSKRLAERLDWLGLMRWVPSASSEARAAGIDPAQADRAMQMISGGRRVSGFHAVKRIALRVPITWMAIAAALWISPWFALLFAFLLSPLFTPLGERGYAWIARNRHRLMKGGACELPKPGKL
jgi:predicted DCC family thiol-disulfide oxidoreductase YuxK